MLRQTSTNFNGFVIWYQALEGFGEIQTVLLVVYWRLMAQLHCRSACGYWAFTTLTFWGISTHNFIKVRITSECKKHSLQKFSSNFTFAKIGQSKLILGIATFYGGTEVWSGCIIKQINIKHKQCKNLWVWVFGIFVIWILRNSRNSGIIAKEVIIGLNRGFV